MPESSSHFDPDGDARMVDVTNKSVTVREAIASGQISMRPETADVIRRGNARKGDVLGIARIAAIQSTKLTSQIIPLCHAIAIEAVAVNFDWPETNRLCCLTKVRTTAKTGVEMEAMTAVAVACLTVYDMVKSIDRGMSIGPIRLEQKSGGKSGEFRNPAVSDPLGDNCAR